MYTCKYTQPFSFEPAASQIVAWDTTKFLQLNFTNHLQ